MNKDQAKEILDLYRPWAADDQDPETAEALNMAKGDPELAVWLEEHCALQEAIRAKFRETAVPEGLMEQIVSERKSALTSKWQQKAMLLALTVAVLVGVLGLAKLYWPARQEAQDNTFEAFRLWTARKVLREYPQMDLETNDLAQIQQAVQKHSGPDYALPKPLAAARPTGCATNMPSWNGHPVSMICFNSGKTPNPAEPDLFLFITDSAAVPGAPASEALQFTNIVRLTTASWTDGKKAYVLGGFGDAEFIKKYL